ncbi:MAG: hypothetical protein WCK28_02535 [Burkholderiales bacterium]|jgi:hypothetical protein
MHHRPPSHPLRPIAAAIALTFAASGASAVTVSAGTPTINTSNLGPGAPVVIGPGVSTSNVTAQRDLTSSTIDLLSSEVVLAPTETTSGLLALYSRPQTTTTWLQDGWLVDTLDIDVLSSGGNKSGGKWISIAGTVTSETALDIRFSMLAQGSFDPMQTPFGPAVPPLAAFYFGQSAPSATPSTTTNADLVSLTYSANTFSSQYGTTTFSLLPGVTQPFAAYVYAGQDVSISAFELTGTTTRYGYTVTPRQQIVLGDRRLVGTEVIAPIPEAEPALILAAGLGAVAVLSRRRRRATP